MPEGQLSASYDWSVSQVQYKALQADTFGSPPANSYTDYISLPMRRDKLCRVSGCDVDVYATDHRLLASSDELQRDRDGCHNQSILERQRRCRARGPDQRHTDNKPQHGHFCLLEHQELRGSGGGTKDKIVARPSPLDKQIEARWQQWQGLR